MLTPIMRNFNKVNQGGITVWYSYQTAIAFQTKEGKIVVRQNDWSVTTGKHLNALDGGDKESRVSGIEFERLLKIETENTGMKNYPN